MRKFLLIVCSSFIHLAAFAQVFNNTLLGFQEPTTKIQSIQSDGGKHIYYFGLFKGALVRNNQVLLTGNGGDDLFIAKLDTSGKLIWAKNFGGDGNESVNSIANFKYSNGALYFSNFFSYATQIGSFLLSPYGTDRPASSIVKIDTANGNVLWAKKTSLLINSIEANNDVLMVSGNITNSRGAWLYEQQTLQDSSGISRIGLIFLDKSGQFLGRKQIYRQFEGAGNIIVSSPSLDDQNRLIFYIDATRNSTGQSLNLVIGDSIIVIPNQRYFQAVVKTDTSISRVRYKALNTSLSPLTVGGNSTSAIIYGKNKDSLYLLLTTSSAINYTLDGFNVPLQRSTTLAVIDSSLMTKRVNILNQYTGNQSILYTSLVPAENNIYFFGNFNGSNQYPSIPAFPANQSSINIFPGINQLFDLNGPSQSFVVKAKADFTQNSFRSLGNAVLYDGQSLSPGRVQLIGNKIHFNNLQDDTWNPWAIDTSLNIFTGAMIGNSDRAESSRAVKFFNDGSKFILGEAVGKTNFDSTNSIFTKSSTRRDLFFVRLNSSNNLIWYKRLISSYRNASSVKTVIKNDVVYVLLRLSSPANMSAPNFIKIDSFTRTITSLSTYSVIVVFYKNGGSRLIDLTSLPGGGATSFDVLTNNELVLITPNTNTAFTHSGIIFPAQSGFFIAQSDSLGNILQLLKYYTTVSTYGPSPVDLLVHPNNNDISVISTIGFGTLPNRNFILTNGLSRRDTFSVINPLITKTRTYFDVMKIRFSGSRISSTLGPIGNSGSFMPPYVLSGSNLFMSISKNCVRDPFYFNNQVFDLDSSCNVSYIFGIDTLGQLSASHKFFPPQVGNQFPFTASSLSSYGNYIYASGSLFGPTVIDTIQVNYSGSTDGLVIKFDSTLAAKKIFRIHSILYESVNDCSILNDSLIAFAYNSQINPSFQTARTEVSPIDLDNDAYTGTSFLNEDIGTFSWIDFRVTNSNRDASIYFKTRNEQNVTVFNLEHSINGVNWIVLSPINPTNLSGVNEYSFLHLAPPFGSNFYRIRSLERSGISTYTSIKEVGIYDQILYNSPPSTTVSCLFNSGIPLCSSSINRYRIRDSSLNQSGLIIDSLTGVISGMPVSNSPITFIVEGSFDNRLVAVGTFAVSIDELPTVSQLSNLSFCKGDSSAQILFSGSISGTLFSWINDNPSIGLPPSGTQFIPGFITQNVSTLPLVANITVTPNINGCMGASRSFSLTVNPLPTSSFSLSSNIQCLFGNSFSFTNSSAITFGSLTHAWTFGDGGTATTLNATRSYSAPGTYPVKLVSISNSGCKDSTTQQVVVNPMPTSSYTIGTATQCLTGNSFTFTNSSVISSGNLTHTWSFGDGGTATTLNATRSYVAPGAYPVKLISTSDNGCKDSTTQQVIVNPMPVSLYSINTAAQCLTGNSFTFTNNSSIASGTLTHAWIFGDGGIATTLNASQTYSAAGTYSVKLVSTSNNGCKDSTTQQLLVHPMPASSYGINTAAQCLTGNSFRFTNSSTIANGTLTSHVWSFGDGGTATTLNATKTYGSAGTYSVKLVSTSNNGCKDSTTQQVVVNPMPASSYSINTASQCLTDNIFSFTNNSAISSGTLTHLWSFGDGGTATTLNATKTYGSAGTYSVKLVSTSNNGCKDSTSQQVVVNPMPASSYTINTAAQCLTDNSFTFTNSSTIASGTLTSHLWSFGDGGTATTLNATRSYVAPGIYPVKLVSTSNNGCKDSTTRQVTVHPMPVSGFTVNPAIQCLTGNSFSFNNTSTVSGGTTTSNWNFGNGSTSTSQSPTFTYLIVGAYTVKLVSTSNNGCKDSTTRDVRVDPSPTATLTVAPYRSIHPGLLPTINASIAPAGTYKYTWYRNNQLISNETTTSVDSIGYRLWSGAYKMAIENLPPQLPCSYTTPELVIGDSVSSKLFIYPNPNNGQFRVTYYSPTNTRYQVVVMDMKGAVLYRKPHEVTNRYQLIDINLQGASSGLYLLQIQDPTGKQLASGQLVIH